MNPHIYRDTPSDINKVAELLKSGEVVAIPTETVYGLAANATNVSAVSKIFRIKRRSLHNPLIIHIGNHSQINEYCEVNPTALQLAQAFWPGPLTLVLPKKANIPDIVTAGLDSVGVRMPNHPLTLQLLSGLSFPIAAPSANPSKYISPTTAEHVAESLGDVVEHILDGGTCKSGIESTIIDLRFERSPKILRQGPITRQILENLLGEPVLEPAENDKDDEPKTSPGQEHVHYSPHTPLRLLSAPITTDFNNSHYGYIIMQPQKNSDRSSANTYIIANHLNPRLVEQNLYATLRKADQAGHEQLFIELPPQGSDWDAIRDRITRAANT